MRRDLSEDEFIEWKRQWLLEKGCPFFTCAQAVQRKVCGKDYLCGVLYDYEKYKLGEWRQVCDVQLELDTEEKFPATCCPSCTNSMCLSLEEKVGKSCCPYMNDFYEDSLGIETDRSLEKYFGSLGSFVIPFAGEDAYLKLQTDEFKKYK